MTDDPSGREPPFRDLPGGLPVLLRAHARRAGSPGPEAPPRIEMRSASIRLPGIVALLLAIPAFFLFGLIAIMLVVAGAVGMLVGPWMLRRMIRRMEAEVPASDTTIDLDRSAYTDGGGSRDQARAAINRSSSSRKRGNTSV